jgi:hypothetical protein
MNSNTVYALRGNTASGKTTTVKRDPDLSAKVLDENQEVHGAMNPDNIKSRIMDVHKGRISSSQAHMEGSNI